jgi:hypothetical protein
MPNVELNRRHKRPKGACACGFRQPVRHPPCYFDQLRERLRYARYSLSTEKAYGYWVDSSSTFTTFGTQERWADPRSPGLLSWLVTKRRLSASAHKQALAALLFLPGRP